MEKILIIDRCANCMWKGISGNQYICLQTNNTLPPTSIPECCPLENARSQIADSAQHSANKPQGEIALLVEVLHCFNNVVSVTRRKKCLKMLNDRIAQLTPVR